MNEEIAPTAWTHSAQRRHPHPMMVGLGARAFAGETGAARAISIDTQRFSAGEKALLDQALAVQERHLGEGRVEEQIAVVVFEHHGAGDAHAARPVHTLRACGTRTDDTLWRSGARDAGLRHLEKGTRMRALQVEIELEDGNAVVLPLEAAIGYDASGAPVLVVSEENAWTVGALAQWVQDAVHESWARACAMAAQCLLGQTRAEQIERAVDADLWRRLAQGAEAERSRDAAPEADATAHEAIERTQAWRTMQDADADAQAAWSDDAPVRNDHHLVALADATVAQARAAFEQMGWQIDTRRTVAEGPAANAEAWHEAAAEEVHEIRLLAALRSRVEAGTRGWSATRVQPDCYVKAEALAGVSEVDPHRNGAERRRLWKVEARCPGMNRVHIAIEIASDADGARLVAHRRGDDRDDATTTGEGAIEKLVDELAQTLRHETRVQRR